MKEKKEYVTTKYIAKMYQLNLTTVERRAKSLLGIEGVEKTKSYKIKYDLIPLFLPRYTKSLINPREERVLMEDWKIFADFVPVDKTPPDVLIAVMKELFTHLAKETLMPLQMFYAIEIQPKVLYHVHFCIQTDIAYADLKRMVYDRIYDLSWSKQYGKKYMNELKEYTLQYLEKGKVVNYKNATFIHSEILTKGIRKK